MPKVRSLKILETINVPTPCSQSWDEMQGDHSSRYCKLCAHSVLNLSALSKERAAELLENRGDARLCVRYSTDVNGDILFEGAVPHPVSERPILWQRGAMFLGAILSLIGVSNWSYAQSSAPRQPDAILERHTVGMIAAPTATPLASATPTRELLGELDSPQTEHETPDKSITPIRETVGKIAARK